MPDEAGLLIGIESTVFAVESGDTHGTPMLPAARERYEPRGLLGEGGMGRVECGWDRDLLREVAIKQLRAPLYQNARLLEQFLWEARVTAYLDHPNIVPVHDLGVTREGHLYFTMKRIRGGSLEAAITQLVKQDGASHFTNERRLRSFVQLAQAVSFAHSHGVLHRDLKPANVMMGAHGEVLVTDWGLALPMPSPAGNVLREYLPKSLQTTGSGTPAYMSPEQARQEPLDERSDIFALGAILYELFELERAFQAPTVPALLIRVSQGEMRPMQRCSAPLQAVIRRACAIDKAERYQHASELIDDVEAVLDGRAPQAENASVVKQAARYYVSHDRAFDHMRVVDFDLWAASAAAIGIAIGILLAPHVAWSWAVFLVAGIVVGAPPTIRWLRFRKLARPKR